MFTGNVKKVMESEYDNVIVLVATDPWIYQNMDQTIIHGWVHHWWRAPSMVRKRIEASNHGSNNIFVDRR